MPYKDTKRESARTQGTYDVYIEIDIDCQELLEACDVEYTLCRDDDQSVLSMTNEQTLATALLNHELGEYTTKVTIYTPYGDKITFE